MRHAILFLASIATASSAWAGATYSFEDIWKLASTHSPELQAAGHELEAARINEARQSRHWYPTLHADARAFTTNDPAMSFMSLLGQRQLTEADFAPARLNEPGSSLFEHATLGLDFPLYEGGSKVAAAQSASKMTEAKSYEREAARVSEYAELGGAYASILALERQRAELGGLSQNVEETLSRYHIGARANPVGYSGLLGLRNLHNRLKGLLLENEAKESAVRARVRILARDLPSDWRPSREDPEKFLASNLAARASEERPVSVRAMQAGADALDQEKTAEKAKFLPKIGLFANGDLYGGNRAAATSYSAGAYLQWAIFSAPSFGATDQAGHAAAAAQARADAAGERAEIARVGAVESIESLEKNLALMGESAALLEEQTATARELFRSGSITALQVVEVLSRGPDLLVSRADAQQALAQARATVFASSGTPEGEAYGK